MIQVSLRATIVVVALLAGSSPGLGQVMQRRIPRPAPASPASPAPDSAPTAIAPNAPSPSGCPKDYVGPPLIASVEPLDGTWPDNTITPFVFDPSDPDSFSYHFIVKGCGLKSKDTSHREQLGFDLGQGLTLVDDGVASDVYHADFQLLYAPSPFVQDALHSLKETRGPFRIVVVTPLGRAQTEQIYRIAPGLKPALRDANASSGLRAGATDLACVQDPQRRLLRVGPRPGGVQFTNVGRWTLHGCDFGSATGAVQLISRGGAHIPLRVVSWSEQTIDVATDDPNTATTDQDAVAVSIAPPQGQAIASPNVHRYRVFKPMPEGSWKTP